MKKDPKITNLEQLLDVIEHSAVDRESVSLGIIVQAVGRRTFGPILLLAGLIIIFPIVGDIPGVPTVMGILVLLTAGQLIVRRKHFWLPAWMLNRSVKREKLCKGVHWIRPAARFMDRWLKPRLVVFTKDGGTALIALICIMIALAIPPMELIPFSANGAGIALMAFGLALISHDGLLALFAMTVMGVTIGLIAYNMV